MTFVHRGVTWKADPSGRSSLIRRSQRSSPPVRVLRCFNRAVPEPCPPEKPRGSLILGRPFGVVAESRLRESPRHSPFLLLVPLMVPMSYLHFISCSFGGVGD
jgi:hypothetical protein